MGLICWWLSWPLAWLQLVAKEQFFFFLIQMTVSLLQFGSLRLGSLSCVFVYLFRFWSPNLQGIWVFFFFFFCKIVYGPKNGLGFLELKLLYVFFVKNLRGSVIKSRLVYVLNNIIYIFTHFFYLYILLKNINNITKTILPNWS